MKRNRKPKDPNKRAFQVVREATEADQGDEVSSPEPERKKNPAAVALGRLGGKKGGKARAESMSAAKRAEIARKAALARWGKKDDT